MDGTEVRRRRRAVGMTQAQFADAIGVSTDYVGQMERGAASVAPRTAAAIQQVRRPSTRTPRASDPMERLVEEALVDAGISFVMEGDPGQRPPMDFYLPDMDVHIEVKRFHSPRIAEQMARAPNVIAAQGEAGVRALAGAIRHGLFAAQQEKPE